MNQNLTEIVFLLDRSGSMSYLTDDTIGGYNSFIEKQKNEPGEAKLTTVLFDDKYELLHNGTDLKTAEPLNRTTYFARGSTALYDALGKTINDVGHRLAKIPEEERPSKVIFVITTDGFENASKEFTQSAVKEMITHQTEKYSWEFIFLGANIDSAEVGASMGISVDRSFNYTASAQGTSALYSTLSASISDYRVSGTINTDAIVEGLEADAKSYSDIDITDHALKTDMGASVLINSDELSGTIAIMEIDTAASTNASAI